VIYARSAHFVSLIGGGFARREIFPHKLVAIQKPYPDAKVLLEGRGLQQQDLEHGEFLQLNLYTTNFYGLPIELFIHPQINWHRQQLGQIGLIAAAGLWFRDSVATISTLQSDLCQQLYRHSALKHLCKTQVDTHFKYWYAILFNAILNFCIDFKITTIHSPTGQQVVSNTRKAIDPNLFYRIYDYPGKAYCCRKIWVGPAQYWEVPVHANLGRVTRLSEANSRSYVGGTIERICVFHDIEENVDTPISSAQCADNLGHMLQIERYFGLNATYNILGTLFTRKVDQIRASNPKHSIGFHSFNHDLADLTQLSQCRRVDLRVRGYRPPQSRITSELSDYNLTKLNFEWFACGARSLGYAGCHLENGIAKIPIHLDDYPLFLGKPYEQWESELLNCARATPFFSFGLHDCYAGKWLERYRDLLGKLAAIRSFATADEISDCMFLNGSASS
jgi:hypothetical protein